MDNEDRLAGVACAGLDEIRYPREPIPEGTRSDDCETTTMKKSIEHLTEKPGSKRTITIEQNKVIPAIPRMIDPIWGFGIRLPEAVTLLNQNLQRLVVRGN
jgi:hypothetical protein